MCRRTKIKLQQLALITGAWLIVGILLSIYDHLELLSGNSLGPSPEYSFTLLMSMHMAAALMGSLLGGSILIFFINVRYPQKSYGSTIVAISIAFVLIVSVIIMVVGIITVTIQTGKPISDPVSMAAFRNYLTDTARIKNIMVWSIVVAFTQLLLQINSKFGQGTLGNIIRGKYVTPKEENRIFMFLDLNSSTTMAERLGDEKYHELLKDFFADITNPILDNSGEIYQYAGDEVIVAWKHEDGIKNCRCVQCFFDIKIYIEQKKEKYLQRYHLVPSFKAGIHCGKVIAGEVGIIKRDITYSGDVLNTTSRIISMCKKFNAEFISSADLIQELHLNSNYVTQPLGSIKLRGKEKEILLNALVLT